MVHGQGRRTPAESNLRERCLRTESAQVRDGGQVEHSSDATSVFSKQMRKCDRKRINEASLRNALQALIRRANGIERVLGPNVHLTFADCRSRVNVRVEFIDRQNFPIASSTQHDDLPMLAGDVDLAVDADG